MGTHDLSDQIRADIKKYIADMDRREACLEWRFGKSGAAIHGGDTELTDLFQARFKELGGFTPEISKSIGR